MSDYVNEPTATNTDGASAHNNDDDTTANGSPATVQEERVEFRVEVVANRSVQEDFFDRLKRKAIGGHYTLFPEVQGAGIAGPRRGDHIWPEENFVYVAYVGKSEARAIKAEVDDLKLFFKDEGIRFFAVPAAEL